MIVGVVMTKFKKVGRFAFFSLFIITVLLMVNGCSIEDYLYGESPSVQSFDMSNIPPYSDQAYVVIDDKIGRASCRERV